MAQSKVILKASTLFMTVNTFIYSHMTGLQMKSIHHEPTVRIVDKIGSSNFRNGEYIIKLYVPMHILTVYASQHGRFFSFHLRKC